MKPPVHEDKVMPMCQAFGDPRKSVRIRNADGVPVQWSRNLRCIPDRARELGFGTVLQIHPEQANLLQVTFRDGSYCHTAFNDPRVLAQWIANRIRYGRGKFEGVQS